MPSQFPVKWFGIHTFDYMAFFTVRTGKIQLQANVVYTAINYNMPVSGRETFIKCRFGTVT